MFRPALLTAAAAATLAFGALNAVPAEAAARLTLAPETTLTAAEWSATGVRSGTTMVPVGSRHGNLEDCAAAAPVVRVGVLVPNRDECAAGAIVPVGYRHP